MAQVTSNLTLQLDGDNRNLQIALEAASQKLKQLNDTAQRASKNLTLAQKLDRVSQSLNNVSNQLAAASASVDRFSNKVGIAFAAATATAIGFAKASGTMEQWGIAFGTMLGSTEAAKETLDDLLKFAKRTPFEVPGVIEQSKKLLAFGFENENLISTMQMLGDISAGVGTDKLPQLTLAYGQVRSATRLTGMELRQFTEAGVPLLEVLGQQLNKTGLELRDMISRGEVSFTDVKNSLSLLNSEGGRFFNLMEKQSETLFGIFNNIKDSIFLISARIGDAYKDELKDLGSVLMGMVDAFMQMPPEKLEKYVDKFLDLTTALGGLFVLSKVSALFIGFTSAITSGISVIITLTTKIPLLVASFNPWIAAIGAATVGLGLLIYNLKDTKNEVEKGFLPYREQIRLLEEQKKATLEYIEEQEKLGNLELASKLRDGLVDTIVQIEKVKNEAEKAKESSKNTSESIIEDVLLVFLNAGAKFGDELQKIFLKHQLEIKKAAEEAEELSKAWEMTVPFALKNTEDAAKKAFNQVEFLSKSLKSIFGTPEAAGKFGALLVQDFEQAASQIQDIFQQKITNSLSAKFSDFLQDKTAEGGVGALSSFLGGAGGALITAGVTGIITSVLGEFGVRGKSVEEYAQEAFERMVKNTNRALEKIGQERTKIDKQLDIVRQLESSLGPLALIPEQLTPFLEMDFGTTIQEAMVNLLNAAQFTNVSTVNEMQTSLDNARKKVEVVQDLIDLGYDKWAIQDPDTSLNRLNEAKIGINEFQSTYGTLDPRTVLSSFSDIITGDLYKFLNTEHSDDNYYGFFSSPSIRKKVLGDIQGTEKFISKLESDLSKTSEGQLDRILDSLRLTNEIVDALNLNNTSLTDFLPSFDVGAINVPSNMMANLHAGEMIIPKTFADGIRGGQLELKGAGTLNKNQNVTIQNTININGGNKSPRQLYEEIRPYISTSEIKDDLGSFRGYFS